MQKADSFKSKKHLCTDRMISSCCNTFRRLIKLLYHKIPDKIRHPSIQVHLPANKKCFGCNLSFPYFINYFQRILKMMHVNLFVIIHYYLVVIIYYFILIIGHFRNYEKRTGDKFSKLID